MLLVALLVGVASFNARAQDADDLATLRSRVEQLQDQALYAEAVSIAGAEGSEAAASLAQMAARSAKGSREVAALVREQQDLLAEWQVQERQLIGL
jgi:histidine ammonia-lyase